MLKHIFFFSVWALWHVFWLLRDLFTDFLGLGCVFWFFLLLLLLILKCNIYIILLSCVHHNILTFVYGAKWSSQKAFFVLSNFSNYYIILPLDPMLYTTSLYFFHNWKFNASCSSLKLVLFCLVICSSDST